MRSSKHQARNGLDAVIHTGEGPDVAGNGPGSAACTGSGPNAVVQADEGPDAVVRAGDGPGAAVCPGGGPEYRKKTQKVTQKTFSRD